MHSPITLQIPAPLWDPVWSTPKTIPPNAKHLTGLFSHLHLIKFHRFAWPLMKSSFVRGNPQTAASLLWQVSQGYVTSYVYHMFYHMCVICVSYVYHMCVICVSYVYHMCIICVSYVYHMCIICHYVLCVSYVYHMWIICVIYVS
jgi:hypothetical protein